MDGANHAGDGGYHANGLGNMAADRAPADRGAALTHPSLELDEGHQQSREDEEERADSGPW
jgi:hypothetical protein